LVPAVLSETQTGFNVPLKCSPEEYKHFVQPAMAEANKSNYSAAMDIVNNGLNAHAASEGLLFLKAYFGYKLADRISDELGSLPKAFEPLGDGVLMIDGGATTAMLGKFKEIIKVLGEAENAIEEFLQINPTNPEVTAFKSYVETRLRKLGQESENVRATFNNSPNIAGGFCAGCRKNISFETQKIVFRRAPTGMMQVWHFPCFERMSKQN